MARHSVEDHDGISAIRVRFEAFSVNQYGHHGGGEGPRGQYAMRLPERAARELIEDLDRALRDLPDRNDY